MYKTKFIVIKLKKIIFPLSICIFTMLLLVFSSKNIDAAKAGLALWRK